MEDSSNAPAPGSRWVHKNGNEYEVLMLANERTLDPDRYPVNVVYRGNNGRIWCRPLAQWHRSMTPCAPATPGMVRR